MENKECKCYGSVLCIKHRAIVEKELDTPSSEVVGKLISPVGEKLLGDKPPYTGVLKRLDDTPPSEGWEETKPTRDYINTVSGLNGFAEVLQECGYDFHAGRKIEKLANYISQEITHAVARERQSVCEELLRLLETKDTDYSSYGWLIHEIKRINSKGNPTQN